jgi:hypothetical protein
MSTCYDKMLFEMELRGYSPQTQKHYLNHVRLLFPGLSEDKPLSARNIQQVFKSVGQRVCRYL